MNSESYWFEAHTLYFNGLKYCKSCIVLNIYDYKEEELQEELIDAAFGC